MNDPFIRSVIDDLKEWPYPVLKRHNDAKLLLHKLAFLAELDYTVEERDIAEICSAISANRSDEGVVQLMVNIPKHFGGSGTDSYSWMLCDAPLLHYSLHRMGVDRAILERGTEYLFSLGQSYGYPCAVSPLMGKFNGPGKRGTICPYATLLMLRLYSLFPDRHNDESCRASQEALLGQLESHDKPYLFGTGKKFRKLKYPFIWYDILHVAEVLTRFDFARKDRRLKALVDEIAKEADAQGLYKAGSVWTAWKGIDAGQKKNPSQWITSAAGRIISRMT
ncbi:hypothetical protein [Spirochaeta isovalerica]|uniref:Uncharacterized protein n=1 Tax=Spirochaeta isovalerica TaxID=150 RepID=A0A841RHK9_9SPIO|nr:hypothetical protein [Spirochaeta isovalerica]MBB6482259.1 hypothetical protein [Spirochaeta isovalerica]